MSDNNFTQWLAANPDPSLAELIQRHGSYAAIPSEARANTTASCRARDNHSRESAPA